MSKLEFSGWMLTGSAFLILIVTPALQDGMFTDGLLYASVAKNLAEGRGTIWNLHFTAADFQTFSEQPPLGLILQAFFFKVIGNSIYAERLYNLLMASTGILLMRQLWKLIAPDYKRLSWLPVLAFIIMPVTFWAYPNNVLETTMLNFDLAAVILILTGMKKGKYGYFLMASLMLAGASLVKGIQGLFPLVLPSLYILIPGRPLEKRMAIIGTLLLIAALICIYLPLAIVPDSSESILRYFYARFPETFSGVYNTTGNRFHLLKELILDLLPALILMFIAWLVAGKQIDRQNLSAPAILILLALSGIVPLMVTLEQRGFYLLTALPYLAIALFLPLAKPLSEKLQNPVHFSKSNSIPIGMTVLLMASLTYTLITFRQTKRDHQLIENVHLIGKHVQPHAVIKSSLSLKNHWSLKGYLARYYHIGCGPYTNEETWYLLQSGDKFPSGYLKVNIPLKELILLHRPRESPHSSRQALRSVRHPQW
jgi:4-amino-4-deoxy-L-arabinose transferase-like glycosyltransferase